MVFIDELSVGSLVAILAQGDTHRVQEGTKCGPSVL